MLAKSLVLNLMNEARLLPLHMDQIVIAGVMFINDLKYLLFRQEFIFGFLLYISFMGYT